MFEGNILLIMKVVLEEDEGTERLDVTFEVGFSC